MELEVAMVYGNALYGAAKDTNQVDEIRDEIVQLDEIFGNETQFYELLTNPAVSNVTKKSMIDKVFKGKLSTEVLSFMYILVDKGRFFHFHKIVREYCKMLNDERSIGVGVVYSAVPLNKQQVDKFAVETGKLLKKTVNLKNEVDPSLIGGVKIFVEGKLIDASLKSRLEKLAEQIKES